MAFKKSHKPQQTTTVRAKRTCYYCDNGKTPDYTDSQTLRKFMNDRSRIAPRARTGACSRHQRFLTKEVKYARHLALLPFVTKI